MSDNASVTLANDSAVIHEISLCIDQAILEIQYYSGKSTGRFPGTTFFHQAFL